MLAIYGPPNRPTYEALYSPDQYFGGLWKILMMVTAWLKWLKERRQREVGDLRFCDHQPELMIPRIQSW